MATVDTPRAPAAAGARAARPARDLRRFWRTTAAVVAPLPLLALAGENLVAPFPLGAAMTRTIAGTAADPGAARIGLWLSAVFGLGIVPATMVVAWVARRGAPRLALAGGIVTLAAFAAGAQAPASDLAALVAAQKGLEPALVAALDDAVWAHPGVGVPVLLFLLGQTVGLVLLGLALWRARVAPAWVGPALAVSGPAHLLMPGGNVGAAAGWALTALGYAGASVALLRMRDDEFDLPPAGRGGAPAGSVTGRDPRTVWRVLLAVTAPVAAVFVTVLRYLLPYDMSDGPREIFDKLVAAPGFLAAGIWLGGVVALVSFTGVMAVAWVTRRHTPVLTTVAVLLALPGFIALSAMGPYGDVVAYTVGTRADVDRETAFQLVSGMQASAQTSALLGVFVVGHLVGTVLLGLALWRARLVPSWLAVGLAVSQPIHLVSVLTGIRELDLVGWGLTAAGFAAAGWLLLRMRNDEFDLPPLSR